MTKSRLEEIVDELVTLAEQLVKALKTSTSYLKKRDREIAELRAKLKKAKSK